MGSTFMPLPQSTSRSAQAIFCRFGDKSPDHNFMIVPVHMLDEERRSGIGNERQEPVWLRFSLYQGANWRVLNGASYRGRRSDIALTSKPRANRRSPLASTFNGPANSV